MPINDFKQALYAHYDQNKRDLPWRVPNPDAVFDPYIIMVSEVMLQQTQVTRVAEKYNQFFETFPDIRTLAQASLSDVLSVWQGLGYNRRARFLRDAAIIIDRSYNGHMPRTVTELVNLPGIGQNTACAILVYSYNQPLAFIETNIRSVYLHYFFPDRKVVPDKEILELLEQTLDRNNPREFYWALMDYGAYIKKTFGNPNIRSKEYTKQSVFEGSKRQLRGTILRRLNERPCSMKEMQTLIDDSRLEAAVEGLVKDQLVARRGHLLKIAT